MAVLRFPASRPIFMCSAQHHSTHNAFAPISERHISARLASSLLRQPMQTPQGEALMAFTNQGLPPCFISVAASRQLELLAALSASATFAEDTNIHRRIVEMKARDQHKEAVQEILFALVASKLLHAMRPPALPGLHGGTMRHAHQQDTTLALQTLHLDDRLQALHAPDVQPLTSRHVAMVINGPNHVNDPVEPNALSKVRTFELGRMYAASVMYGYFLARLHQRFKLEMGLWAEAAPMQTYSNGFNATKSEVAVSMEAYIEGQEFQKKGRIHHLSALSGPLTLNVIEHHCEAMFGSVPKTRQVKTSDGTINIQLGFARTLMYQALAFGALLWDAENRFVPLFYPLIFGED